MIKVFLLVGVWLWCTPKLVAQNAKYTKIKADNDAVKKIPNNQKYAYADFKLGSVAYNTGNVATASFNYNFLLDEMHFISPEGDTLSLANEYLVKLITVGQDTFYYQPKVGYLQVVASYKPVILVVKQTMRILRNEKQAGYDQSSAVSAIKQFSFYLDQNGQVKKLQPKGNLLLTKENSYYIVDQNFKVFRANKAAILKVYAKYTDKINTYLKTNKPNLRQETELKQLLQYCQKLT
ncbi:hypothetical protein [Adhaeribacter pallidiroseus]|uniref:Uncharacterized protein n=1 Tax=Adhaeribacter pallidiroseus TaxID=2072847 RepID=A0A369QRV2_9BACT|nr:hypothetical protein [Adhaeribacter pallidiroseus]RDC66046.1 hypothetical protein AHMF7616_04677 [Adhaeribacter pallidiroseus]